jgi:anaerobic magnesium-protoporphyrin IX monomethyl ester cyclase
MTARSSRVTLVVPPALMPLDDSGVREYLGVGYVASVLRRRGHTANIVDSSFSKVDYDGCVKMALETDPEVVGLTGPFVIDLVSSVGVARRLRRAGFDGPIIVGGQAAAHSWENVLKNCPEIDAVCVGEGETTIVELVEAHAQSGKVEPVPGFAVRAGARFIFSPAPPLAVLDELPFPARDNVATDGLPSLYVREKREGGRRPYLIEGSRGCPFACAHCSVRTFFGAAPGPAWRGRSPENVAAEIVYLQSRWGASDFMFCDDSFFGAGQRERERVTNLTERLTLLRPSISFILECRAADVEPEVFGLLQRAGLVRVTLGIETGIGGALERFGKRVTVEDNVRAVLALAQLGIKVQPEFIFCDPDTTVGDMDELLAFLTRTLLHRSPEGLSAVFDNRLGLFAGAQSYAQYQIGGVTKPWRFGFLSPEEQDICDRLDAVRDYEFSDSQFEVFYALLQRGVKRLLKADEALRHSALTENGERARIALGNAGFRLLETLVKTSRQGLALPSAAMELDDIVERALDGLGHGPAR